MQEYPVLDGSEEFMKDDKLITEIEAQLSLMVAVSTGGPQIQEVNQQYIDRRARIAVELRRRGLADPNPHSDLWDWYRRWSMDDMRKWAPRRAHLSEMYQPLIDQIQSGPSTTRPEWLEEPAGWLDVDRGISDLQTQLEQAQTEKQLLHELARKLPSYMLPKRITILDLLPKNQNGKIDRVALQR